MAKAKNLDALQRALDRKPEAVAPAERRGDAGTSGGSYKAPSREGKEPVTAYLSPAYKRSLRLIQAKRGGTTQSLMAEALNMLFEQEKVPTVSE
jgi:hypothetical protein